MSTNFFEEEDGDGIFEEDFFFLIFFSSVDVLAEVVDPFVEQPLLLHVPELEPLEDEEETSSCCNCRGFLSSSVVDVTQSSSSSAMGDFLAIKLSDDTGTPALELRVFINMQMTLSIT